LRAHRPARLPLLVWATLGTPLDGRAATLYKVALRLATRPYTVEELASACGCSSRTLHRMCREARVGAPQRLKAMSRLFTVGYLMDRPAARLEDVAERLGFDSADALRFMLVRYTGQNTTQMARQGWLSTLRKRLQVERSA
jgi:methylphosphotriester-DNA--protein-cysteine methyltransferase